DGGRRDRRRRPHAGADLGARRTVLVARRRRLRAPGPVRVAPGARRAHREALLMEGPAETIEVRLETLPDAEAAAQRGAELIAMAARGAVAERGSGAIAVSGGTTPWGMFRALADQDVPWDDLGIWQVDERIAPPDD